MYEAFKLRPDDKPIYTSRCLQIPHNQIRERKEKAHNMYK